MKISKKILAFGLTLSMIFAITGCSQKTTVESLVQNADTIMQDAKSIDANMQIAMDMSMAYDSMSMEMGVNMDVDIKAHKESDSAYMISDVDISIFGTNQKAEIESYCVKDGDKYTTYSKEEESNTWTYEESTELDYQSNLNIYKYIKDNIKDFTLLKDTVIVNDKDAYEITGKLSGEALKDIMNSVNTEDGLLEGSEDLNYKDMNIDITCYFDKETKNPISIEMDCTEGISKAINSSDDEKDSQDNMLGEGSIEVKEFSIKLTYNSFDSVDEIEVPKEIKDNAIKATDSSSDFDFSSDYEESTKESTETTQPENIDMDGTDIEDTSVSINEKTYTLPFNTSELLALGYEMDNSDEKILEPEDFSVIGLNKENDYFNAYTYNTSTTEKKEIKDTITYGIAFYADSSNNLKLVFPKGFTFDTTYDELVELFGTPNSYYEGTVTNSYTWGGANTSLSVDFMIDTNKIDRVSIVNYDYE